MNKRSQRSKELAEYRAEQKFHEREWAVQRIGWAVLATIVVAAVTGVFGSGPLANEAILAGGTRIEMDRFTRYNSQSEWRFVIDPAQGVRPLRISLDFGFVQNYEISTITPEPSRSSLADDFIVFEFENDHPLGAIIFHVQPTGLWKHQGLFRVGDSRPVQVSQFVYP